MSQIIFLLALVTVTACQEITIVNQKTICPDDGIIGPSIDFLCPPPTRLVLNGVCCAAEKVKFVPCEDQLDAQGNSLCPLTKLGCFRNLLGPVSLMEEIDLCAKTCGYCRFGRGFEDDSRGFQVQCRCRGEAGSLCW